MRVEMGEEILNIPTLKVDALMHASTSSQVRPFILGPLFNYDSVSMLTIVC